MSLKPLTHSLFTEHFGYAPALTIQAPGRVNLIGEHTDYNDGFVLPCAIDYQTVITCAKRDDRQIRVLAADYQNQQDQFSLDDPIVSHPDQRWSDYVRGVVKHLQRRSADFGGADLVIAGNVPQGGLSSSAALEVAVGQALQALYQLPLDGVALALNGQEAENHRRLQLRHHGSADLRARPARQRSADRLPLAGNPCGTDAGQRRGGDRQLQCATRAGGQRIQHPPQTVRGSGAVLRRRRCATSAPNSLRRVNTSSIR